MTDALPACDDLARHLPGQLARAEAIRRREEAPFRSLVARLMGVHTDERAWRLGAGGEVRVGAELEKLKRRDERWRVLHAIPVGDNGADIDHLVIGPAGVFALNTKHHPDAAIWVGGDVLMVNGVREPYVRNSRHEASRASLLLTSACGFAVEVSGVVVLVNAGNLTIKNPPSDVLVLNRRRLQRWLRGQPEVLDPATCDDIFDRARRSTTWEGPRTSRPLPPR